MKKVKTTISKRKANIKKVKEATDSDYEESYNNIALSNNASDDNTVKREELKEEEVSSQKIIINVKMPGQVVNPNRALDMIGGVKQLS